MNCLLCKYTGGITVTSLIGLFLSIYNVYIKMQLDNDHDYKAACDISEQISCTLVFDSSYGKGFGLIAPIFGEHSILNQSNGTLGIIFYTIIILLSTTQNMMAAKIQVLLNIISNLLSVYLAYVLYFIFADLCIVCVSTYAVNLINLLLSIKRYQLLKTGLYLNDNDDNKFKKVD